MGFLDVCFAVGLKKTACYLSLFCVENVKVGKPLNLKVTLGLHVDDVALARQQLFP